MVLIDTREKTFEEYIASLSKRSRNEYRRVMGLNQGVEYTHVPFVRDDVERFMQLWQRQLVRGRPIEWAFGVGHVENLALRGELMVFEAKEDHPVAMHFIQKRDGFWECHPPCFDKSTLEGRLFGKFMWLSLIRFACEQGLGILDLGGGPNNWHEHIRERKNYPNPRYKWFYVPQDVKDNPEKYQNYTIDGDYNERSLRKID